MHRGFRLNTSRTVVAAATAMIVAMSGAILLAQSPEMTRIIARIAALQNEREMSDDLVNGLFFATGGHKHLVSAKEIAFSPERESEAATQAFATSVAASAAAYANAAVVFKSLSESGQVFVISDSDAEALETLGYSTDPREVIEQFRSDTEEIASFLSADSLTQSDKPFGEAAIRAGRLAQAIDIVGQIQGLALSDA